MTPTYETACLRIERRQHEHLPIHEHNDALCMNARLKARESERSG
jgi:hypothetical protein